jgi:hypothetical protein
VGKDTDVIPHRPASVARTIALPCAYLLIAIAWWLAAPARSKPALSHGRSQVNSQHNPIRPNLGAQDIPISAAPVSRAPAPMALLTARVACRAEQHTYELNPGDTVTIEARFRGPNLRVGQEFSVDVRARRRGDDVRQWLDPPAGVSDCSPTGPAAYPRKLTIDAITSGAHRGKATVRFSIHVKSTAALTEEHLVDVRVGMPGPASNPVETRLALLGPDGP